MRSKALAHNKVYFLSLYKNVPLPEGQEGTVWEHSLTYLLTYVRS
jgi:hypothetical protein